MHKYIVICKRENCYKGIEYMGEESFFVVIVVILYSWNAVIYIGPDSGFS